MTLEIVETTIDHRVIVSNLYQFYLYDFSEMVGFAVEDNGRYEESDLAGCWVEPYIHTFLLKVDGEWAGLSIIFEPHFSRYLGEYLAHYEMAEFFVMRKYRKRGVGRAFAKAMFDRYRGRWRVAELAANVYALKFWRQVIGEYTNGQFEDTTWQGKSYHGTVQFFDNGEAVPSHTINDIELKNEN
jgi:predicted acetyltransferase